MAKNFQTDNFKYTKQSSRDNYNPEFNSTVASRGFQESDEFLKNIDKYADFVAWGRWFPDLFWDLITPEIGGIRLDLDQRVFLRCVARFLSNYCVFPRGYGKCVTGDTLILTDNGIKEIGEYFNYQDNKEETFLVKNINIVNRFGKLEKTNAGVYSGYLPTKKITTEEGFQIEGTHNHPILVMEKNGEINFKNISDAKKGDYVVVSRGFDKWGTNTKVNVDMDSWINSLSKQSSSHLKIRELPSYIDEDISLLIGYLIGDGCLTLDNSILFSNADKDILNNFYRIFKDKFNARIIKKTGNNVDYVISDKYLRKYFEYIGLGYEDAFNKEIPKIILESPKNIISKFIRGLFDTDGGISNSYLEYCTASEKMSKQIQIILLNFGIVSTRKIKFNKKFKTYSYRIMIYGKNIELYKDFIGFSCERKQEQLIKLCEIKRNTNKDIVPFQKENVALYYNDIKKDNTYVYDNIYHILKGNNNLTYSKIEYLLSLNNAENCNKFNELKNILDLHYFFSKISEIEDGNNHVYDLSLPNTNSFVSNGMISHNTLLEVMSMYHVAIFYPGIQLTMTAQTRENASKILEEKHNELLRYYPLLKNEILKPKFSKDSAEILFVNDSKIDIMANHQSSKGARRHREQIEESALLNNSLFEDVLEPIVNVPRRTAGKKAIVSPEELNGQINFYTTSSYRGCDEFYRSQNMIKDMVDLNGKIILGADWQLACFYGRGERKAQILDKKARLSPTFFAMNYCSKWVGSTENSLVNIAKVMELRTLLKPEFKAVADCEYVLGVDVARSEAESNNKSSIAVGKIIRTKNKKKKELVNDDNENNESLGVIRRVELVNLITMSNSLTFEAQAIEVKRFKDIYKAKVVITDTNGLGSGLRDELLKEHIDPISGKILKAFATINTDLYPETKDYDKCFYELTPQSANHDIIISFIDFVESKKLRLLEKKSLTDYDINDKDNYVTNIVPFENQDRLTDEIANLQVVETSNKKFTLKKVVRKIDKDRFSAVAYMLWYIKTFENTFAKEEFDYSSLFKQSSLQSSSNNNSSPFGTTFNNPFANRYLNKRR